MAANIDWLKYEQAEITVTLSASEKSLKEKAKSFVSRISSEIGLIETQEHADEIMVEYKQTLLLADSIRLIQRRYEALQKEKEKKERIAAEKALKAAAAAKVSAECAEQNPPQANPAPPVFKPPTETTVQQRMDESVEMAPPAAQKEPVPSNREILQLTFTVRGTRTELRALKQFLTEGGYDFE